jgi:hypothetical protein
MGIVMRIAILSFFLLVLGNSIFVELDFSKSLAYAYKKDDTDSLLNLLKAWNESIVSNESDVEADKYASEVYSIFNEFYTPFDLNRVGSSEFGDSLYIGKFAIVQNSIKYALAEFPDPDTIVVKLKDDTLTLSELEKEHGKDSRTYGTFENLKYPSVQDSAKVEIKDFRPETVLPAEKKLYLTSYYKTELIQFLGDQHSPLGAGGIMNPTMATKKTWKRQHFLNKYLNVIYGHWGGYWHLETHPEVYLVVINPSSTKAALYFRLVYEGGQAYLEKQNGKWMLIESKRTWIE